MNIQLLKYAIEVSRTGSMTKAAENLYMSQPNLSRAIKELEELIGIPLFKRTSKGIFPTAQGEEFLVYAHSILEQIRELQTMYKQHDPAAQLLRVSSTRAGYVSEAVAALTASLSATEKREVLYKETNAMRALSNVLQGDCDIAIIRYPTEYENYFSNFFREKELQSEKIREFEAQVLLHCEHPAAKADTVCADDFKDGVELVFGDPYIPSLPQSELKKSVQCTTAKSVVTVFDRASAYQQLITVEGSFMFTSPEPTPLIHRYGLVQRVCPDIRRVYRDVAVCYRHHKYTALEQRLLDRLIECERI